MTDKVEIVRKIKHVIHFNDDINRVTVNKIKSATISAMQYKQAPATEIYYMFSSDGGDVGQGIELYNFLRGVDVPITMHNLSNVGSIATLVFIAADNRLVVPGGRFLFHKFSFSASAGDYYVFMLNELAASLDSYMNIYTRLFQERIDGFEKLVDLKSVIAGNSVICTAEDSITLGITHKIVPPDNLISNGDIQYVV